MDISLTDALLVQILAAVGFMTYMWWTGKL